MRISNRGMIFATALVVAAVALPACQRRNTKIEQKPDLPKRLEEPEQPRPVIAVRKIAFDDGQVVGYLKVHEDLDAPVGRGARVYWVHDSYFKVLGFYTERGDTYRANRDGGFSHVGTYDVDDGKRILLRAPRDVKLQLLSFDAPRTLDGDAEKARESAEAAAKAKAAAEKPADGAAAEEKPN